MKRTETRQFGLVCAMICGLLVFSTIPAMATDFTAAEGNWNVAGNWSGGIPGSGSYAYIGVDNIAHVTDTQGAKQIYTRSNSSIYIESGADLTSEYAEIDNDGTVIQSGGKFTCNEVYTGKDNYGEYKLYGGELSVARLGVSWAGGSTGLFQMGNAAGTGSITETASGTPLYITMNDAAFGIFEGWGTVSLTGQVYNGGQVRADGFGTDRDLDMDALAYVNDAETSASNRGWYAQNKGRLLLPSISVNAGSSTVNWGDDSVVDAPTVDMVNSVQVGFVGASAGALDISLLATDRTDVPGFSGDLIGVWDISGPSFTSADLTIRYDDALASSMGLTEDDLMLFQYTGGSWVDVTSSIDTANNLITGSASSSFSNSKFAVGVVPEPATIGLLVLGFGLLYRRR